MKCQVCSLEFEHIPKSYRTSYARKTCSNACHRQLCGSKSQGKGPVVTLQCERCADVYTRIPSRARGSRFCSKTCMTVAGRKKEGEG